MAKASTSKKTKKTKKLGAGSISNKKAVLVLVAALFVAVGVAGVMMSYAGSSTIKVCNSDASHGSITMYNKNTGSKIYLSKGECSGYWTNSSDQIRVDVESKYASGVNSYKLGEIGEGYGPCHQWSENPSSNPPNVSAVRYRNYSGYNC